MNANDLISRVAVIEYLMTNMGWYDEDGYEVEDADVKRKIITDLIDGIPAVDAAPGVHGRWCDKGSLSCRCSCCGCKSNKEYSYCPNCGAIMNLENNNEGLD